MEFRITAIMLNKWFYKLNLMNLMWQHIDGTKKT